MAAKPDIWGFSCTKDRWTKGSAASSSATHRRLPVPLVSLDFVIKVGSNVHALFLGTFSASLPLFLTFSRYCLTVC